MGESGDEDVADGRKPKSSIGMGETRMRRARRTWKGERLLTLWCSWLARLFDVQAVPRSSRGRVTFFCLFPLMCVECFEVLESQQSDDDWVPVKHKCHSFPLACIRIPFATPEEKQLVLFRTQYLKTAQIPFIQTVYDYYVFNDEIVVIVRQPQITLSDLKIQTDQLTDTQSLQTVYSMVMAVFLAHRHRLQTGRVTLRDFLLF